MPVVIEPPIRVMSQSEFGEIAYNVVGKAIEIHKSFGNVFDEPVYNASLCAAIGPSARSEICVRLWHAAYEKRFYLDLLVESGALFELKKADRIHDSHRAQVIQYMMLTGIQHAKIINFGESELKHEFVNCLETLEQRQAFSTEFCHWRKTDPFLYDLQNSVIELLQDWGTGLQNSTYAEAILHRHGLGYSSRPPTQVWWGGSLVATQSIELLLPRIALKVTCSKLGRQALKAQFTRLIENTDLLGIVWINIVSGSVRFTYLADQNDLELHPL
jgi:GxxExxY protein